MERSKQHEVERSASQSAARSSRDTPRWAPGAGVTVARPFAFTLAEFGGAEPMKSRIDALTRAAATGAPSAAATVRARESAFSRTLAFNGWVNGEPPPTATLESSVESAVNLTTGVAISGVVPVAAPVASMPEPEAVARVSAVRPCAVVPAREAASLPVAMSPTVHANDAADESAVPAALIERAAIAMERDERSARGRARTRAARKVDAQAPLFRAEALAAYQRGERAVSVLRMTSVSGWALLCALASALAIGTVVTVVGRVEETSPARGVMRAAFGVQPAITAIAGKVREVNVQAGAHVEQGDVIARLDATPLEAALDEASQRLEATEAQWQATRGALEASHARGAVLLAARIDLLEQRRRQQERLTTLRDQRAARIGDEELRDVVEETTREQSVEAAAGARVALLQTLEELSALKLQIVTEDGEFAQRIAVGEERVSEARTRRDAARALLEQTIVRAPIAGKVDALRAYPGKVVQASDWLARVVRDTVPETIVAFVPERDAAFLRVGAKSSVALDQLPVGEFGQLTARVTQVGGDLADPSELTGALGDGAPTGPHVRTELALVHDATFGQLRTRLRPGTLVTARIGLRERRLLAIVFEPARRLFR